MYQVLARKWRPQSFDELIGQQHVARTLRNSVQANRHGHAYVFAGVRGTGKTTVARIFAKCLNCEGGSTPSPCGACVPCREIADGRSIDVLEMDAASRTGVDNIRELQEVVSYAPVRDRYKILIIDEAHMLSKQAFNALLKTLEEPPPRVVFVLATTEIQKVLPTILSRCQVFEFRRVPAREIASHLRKVCEAESVRISDAVVDRIARAGEGSVRDSLTLLERVIAFSGETVDEEEAMGVLGAVRTDRLAAVLAALAGRDAAGMLSVLDGLVAEGHDLLNVWSELIAALRDVLLLRNLPSRVELLSRSPEEIAGLEAASGSLSQEDLTRAFQILADLEPGLKASSQPRFLFEAALVRLASLGAVRPIEELLQSFGREPRLGTPSALEGRRPPPSVLPTPAAGQKKKPPDLRPGPKELEGGKTAPSTTTPPMEGLTSATGALAAFRAAVQQARPMLDALLDEASTVRLEGSILHVIYPARADALRRQVARPENLTVLRQCVETIVGGSADIRIAEPSEQDAESPNASSPPALETTEVLPETGEPPGRATPQPAAVDRQALLESARSDPGIQKLLLEFGAQVVDIRYLEATGSPLTDNDTREARAEEDTA